MNILVAYDDSPLSRGALRKAAEHARAFDKTVVAVTVIPEGGVRYFQEKRWIAPNSANAPRNFQKATPDGVINSLRGRVERIAPSAQFDPIITEQQVTTTRDIGNLLRDAISDHHAGDVFVGARDATRIVSTLVDARNTDFHLHLIRRPYIPDTLSQFS